MAEIHGPNLSTGAPELPTELPQRPVSQIEVYAPTNSLAILAKGKAPDSPEYAQLKEKLERFPPFLRISEAGLYQMCSRYQHVVNITGFSGQGVHLAQQPLLAHAFMAIMMDNGWDKRDTLIISGGTALGIPDVAIRSLAGKHGYNAVAVMAQGGVAYPLTPGYSCVCMEDGWVNWGDETQAMAKAGNATILTGGGVQALHDALIASGQDGEEVAVVLNSYNQLGRIPYCVNGKNADLILSADSVPKLNDGIISLHSMKQKVEDSLVTLGAGPRDTKIVQINGIPVNGLVTEVRKDERRTCAQDLLYFVLTGNDKLLPDDFRQTSRRGCERLRRRVLKRLDLYYLLDDPSEGLLGSSVIKVNDVFDGGSSTVIDKIIDHAVEHDVYNPKHECFGPSALGAKHPSELAAILKAAWAKRVAVENRRLRLAA